MEYAVRGPLVIRAGEIEKEIKQVSAEIMMAKCVAEQSEQLLSGASIKKIPQL